MIDRVKVELKKESKKVAYPSELCGYLPKIFKLDCKKITVLFFL